MDFQGMMVEMIYSSSNTEVSDQMFRELERNW